MMREHVFIVSIPENAQPTLGYDSELPKWTVKNLGGFKWIMLL